MKKIGFGLLILFCTLFLFGCTTDEPAVTNDTTQNNNEEQTQMTTAANDQQSELPIVLFQGVTLDVTDRNVDVLETTDKLLSQKFYQKYERKYYLYGNGSLIGNGNGVIHGRGLDYAWEVDFAGIDDYEVAISQDYNPYPRKAIYIKSDFAPEFADGGTVLDQVNNYAHVNAKIVELCTVDLDGDGKNEYIALVKDDNSNFWAKCLIDADYRVKNCLTVFQDEEDDSYQIFNDYTLEESGEIIDINHDGIMEILVDIPRYEGFDYAVFCYKDGVLWRYADYDIMSSLQP